MFELTEENKNHIDSLSYYELLKRCRYGANSDPWLVGKIGQYWYNRIKFLRSLPDGEKIHNEVSYRLNHNG